MIQQPTSSMRVVPRTQLLSHWTGMQLRHWSTLDWFLLTDWVGLTPCIFLSSFRSSFHYFAHHFIKTVSSFHQNSLPFRSSFLSLLFCSSFHSASFLSSFRSSFLSSFCHSFILSPFRSSFWSAFRSSFHFLGLPFNRPSSWTTINNKNSGREQEDIIEQLLDSQEKDTEIRTVSKAHHNPTPNNCQQLSARYTGTPWPHLTPGELPTKYLPRTSSGSVLIIE